MIVINKLCWAWEWLGARLRGDLRVRCEEGPDLPPMLPRHALLHLTVKGQDWMAGMACPCGCGERVELMLLNGMKPRWDLTVDQLGRPTLYPSVHRVTGCRSHFWVRAGQITWCE
jgi:hypothetical protein